MPELYTYHLTDEEAVLYLNDSNLNPTAHAELVQAFARQQLSSQDSTHGLSEKDIAYILEVKTNARKDGKLQLLYHKALACSTCDKKGDYVRFKSGPRKGLPNYKKPTYVHGMRIKDTNVSVVGASNWFVCSDCYLRIRPALQVALRNVMAELPERLMGEPPTYRKSFISTCECGWTGPRLKLIRLPTLMGDGYYHGMCPQCGEEDMAIFGSRKLKTDFTKWEVMPASEEEMTTKHDVVMAKLEAERKAKNDTLSNG